MTESAFDLIRAGLEDALAYAQGDTSRGRVAAPNVKAIRAKTKLSQPNFAKTYHIPLGTLRDWEQERRMPDAGSRTLLSMIEADPEAVTKIMQKISG
ncbi:putative transcriptional regulator [Novosphingobium chloroacetimidivorans]|uniref:Putative transcriptional regulator n=1 Tax=Novosphingobium chloroacetimidivorans TaxID=1428314 RepID=A0A7W7KAV9_9SPHN|nr:transcriptional regulator [Novosphingobium chloroacetimidivorans]MBB4859439.1 putative transcriptional regulator [Novosphingobium chloroacetimidivorans]